MYGKPGALEKGSAVAVRVTSESTTVGEHSVFFNRGVAGSQAYARKFGNKKPDEVADRKAYQWLSRGLEEAIHDFIAQAENKNHTLLAAVYEFNYLPVLESFKKADERGAKVHIVYDNRGKRSPGEATAKAVVEAGIEHLVSTRTQQSYLSHNKFIIFMENDQPMAVWTGSTNFTAGGIFGQSNVGHWVRNPDIAQRYYDYWKRLEADPQTKDLRKGNEAANIAPPVEPMADEAFETAFSPRQGLGVLEWYADKLDAADRSVFMTAAFGVSKELAKVFEKNKAYLRYLLMEKKGKTYSMLTKDSDVRIALGAVYKRKQTQYMEGVHRMLEEELTDLNTWVKYVHNKFMLIDPMSDDPLVISGSANFSKASTQNNDENMLIIRGNTQVADIYLGEFMRMFNHFYYRDVANRQASGKQVERESTYLKATDAWTNPYYKEGSVKMKQRLLFA